MGVVSSRVEVSIDKMTAFRFIADPKNIELVYPESLRFRILEVPERIYDGSRIRMEAVLLGQRFEWYSIIRDYTEGSGFVDEAVCSPFLLWRHTHKVRDADTVRSDYGNGEGIIEDDDLEGVHNDNSVRCIIEDKIEFRTILGPLGDRFAERMISRILEYRNIMMRSILEGRNIDRVEYRDPTRIGLASGSALCAIMTLLGLSIPIFAHGIDMNLLFILNGIAWFLLWFFTHDLLHLLVGRLVGIRFSHFYIGISNLVKALKIDPRYRMLFLALGIKIDRERSKASRYGYASMYMAGPLASMLIPFYVPVYLLINQSTDIVGLFFLTISVVNLLLDAVMSSRHGCIRKGVRALTKH